MDDEQALAREKIRAERVAAQKDFLQFQADMFARIDKATRGEQRPNPASEDLDARILAG
jgi:hypothetical protein